jgi:hypothetical protein
VCDISESLVKVLHLVDGDKPSGGYLYGAMDRGNVVIHMYYEDTREEGFTKRTQIWNLINEQWNKNLHRPIHASTLYLNLTFSYSYGFIFDAKVIDGFLQCVQRMVLIG